MDPSRENIESSPRGTSSEVPATAPAAGPAPILPTFSEASDRTTVNLAHKSAMIIDAFPDRIPNARELEDMTRAFGVELVSMALGKILASVSPNRFFLERVDRVYRNIRLTVGRERGSKAAQVNVQATPTLDRRGLPLDERAELCIIESVDPLTPNATWGGHVDTWRSWGRKAGLTTDVIQTEKKNSLLANAEIIRRELSLQPHDRRIIATVGQGSAEFRLLLEQLLKTAPEELHGIQMWINVSGLIRGGSGVNRTRRSWWSRKMMGLNHAMRGWPSSMAHQLSHTNPRLRLEPELHGLPFVCVSMVGFPTIGDVPGAMKMSFLEMNRVAPNDGLAYFHESILRPGYIVPVPGMSHRSEPDKLGPWFQAVLTAFAFDRDATRPKGLSPHDVAGRSADAWFTAPVSNTMPKDFDDRIQPDFGLDLDFD
ncbi:hypothetical protein BH10BDE1_BH10BDE1_08940 [soil metagenome]